MSDTAKVIERGTGWAILVERGGKAGYIGKLFEGVSIFPSFEEGQRAAIERGYIVTNGKGHLAITDVDERGGVPLVGVIVPKADRVYGHTFRLPDVSRVLGGNGRKA